MSEPDAYLILYGDRRQFRCLVLERATADLRAASLHGVKVPLVVPDEFRHLLKCAEESAQNGAHQAPEAPSAPPAQL